LVNSVSGGGVKEGPADSPSAGSRRDEQAGNDTKAIRRLSRFVAGEIHDSVGTVGMESDVPD
jgi:hypothetical protein